MTNYPDKYIIRSKVAEDCPQFKIKKGDYSYLYFSPEGGGWWQWSNLEAWARRFDSATNKEIVDALQSCNPTNWCGGTGPWFYKPEPHSIEVVAVPAKVKVY